ncbi:acylphosphatase-2 isoform X2 [Falco biarmicus]|uniref:acylphosphatase-2 isoform X2 n=1 Tax=Falco rusticolus TaxID=120794 RepID=UPI0018868A8A|nr:acylphosphatase-2 isoform X2 [Falco rusticolus]XP_055581364.1 acylphosphatase-2 isoform X2 [Falco cherrug]XP_056212748.1 acylphosphatase-2 isoform X2 [Falco biarmicus]
MRAVCRGEGWRPARTQILWSLPGVKISQPLAETSYTEEEARKLGVVGWVKNTSQGTVTGQVQGPEDKVNAMKSWLSKVGSPSSRIDRTNFSNEKEISKLDFSGFSTRY